jgi:hypothetical protein
MSTYFHILPKDIVKVFAGNFVYHYCQHCNCVCFDTGYYCGFGVAMPGMCFRCAPCASFRHELFWRTADCFTFKMDFYVSEFLQKLQ